MPTLLLMRSGRTAWEKEGRLQGALDIPLSPEGIEEVEKQAQAIKQHPLHEVLCGSDLTAVQSAQIVGRLCGKREKPLEEFREMRLGLWEGLLEQEALRRNPTAYRLWRKDPLRASPPRGESVEECFRRASAALKRIAGLDGGPVPVLVCSPMVLAVVRCVAKDVAPHRLWEYVLPPAAVEWVHFR